MEISRGCTGIAAAAALLSALTPACSGSGRADVPMTDLDAGPPPGTPNGSCDVPAEAEAEDTYTLHLCGVEMTDNVANEGGGAIFFVSNDGSGKLVIEDSTLRHNPSHGFETDGYPGIFVLTGADPQVSNSTIE